MPARQQLDWTFQNVVAQGALKSRAMLVLGSKLACPHLRSNLRKDRIEFLNFSRNHYEKSSPKSKLLNQYEGNDVLQRRT